MISPATDTDPTRLGRAALLAPIGLLLVGLLIRGFAYAATHANASPQGLVEAMCVWDCTWYVDVARHGYQAHPETLNFGGPGGIANWAFFPAYPLLLGGLDRIVPIGTAAAGMVLSSLLTLGAVIAARPLFGALSADRRGYLLFAALLLAGPFSFYFSIAYSESLFLFTTVLGFVALQRRRYIAAGLIGAVLAASRTVGVLFVFAIAIEALLELRDPRKLVGRPDIVLAILVAPLGLFAFMAWLYFTTGDALAFAHIQRGWDREAVNPVVAAWAALTDSGGQLRDGQWLALASLAGLALCAVLAWQRRWAMALFSLLCLVLALTQGVESMLRFVVALAPLGIVLCQMLARWRWLFWLSLLAFLVLDYQLTIGWMNQQGALM